MVMQPEHASRSIGVKVCTIAESTRHERVFQHQHLVGVAGRNLRHEAGVDEDQSKRESAQGVDQGLTQAIPGSIRRSSHRRSRSKLHAVAQPIAGPKRQRSSSRLALGKLDGHIQEWHLYECTSRDFRL